MKKVIISIDNIPIHCILGIDQEERSKKQQILISVKLTVDATTAIDKDDINQTINYHALSDKLISEVSATQFFLLETLADHIINICRAQNVLSATVRIEKPNILPHAEHVYVEMSKKYD